MTSQQILYVKTLAEERNFSKAANRLFVSQPALSQYIKHLEDQLGVILFDRSTTPFRITEAGEAFLRAANRIQTATDELNAELADMHNLRSGTLRIGTSPFGASCLLARSLAEYRKAFPGISLRLVTGSLAMLTEQLQNGMLDFIIDTADFDIQTCTKTHLATENYYLAVPQDSEFFKMHRASALSVEDILNETDLFYEAEALSPKVLSELDFLPLSPTQTIYGITNDLCRKAGASLNTVMYADQIETAFHWVLAGLGATLIPDTLMKFGNYTKHPAYFKLDSELATQPITVAFKRNRYVSAAAKEYILLLKRLIGQGTWSSPM